MPTKLFDKRARMRVRPSVVTRTILDCVATHLREEMFGLFEVDAEMEALERLEEDAPLYALGFSRQDADRAFGADRVLRFDLPLYYSSEGAGELLVVFAYFGLAVCIPHAADGDSDEAIIPIDAATRTSHLMVVLRALDALRSHDVEAEPNCGLSRSEGFASLQGNAPAGAVFWDQQSHEAFDSAGNLTAPLHLYWEGERTRIAEILTSALQDTAVGVQVPEDDATTFIISVV